MAVKVFTEADQQTTLCAVEFILYSPVESVRLTVEAHDDSSNFLDFIQEALIGRHEEAVSCPKQTRWARGLRFMNPIPCRNGFLIFQRTYSYRKHEFPWER